MSVSAVIGWAYVAVAALAVLLTAGCGGQPRQQTADQLALTLRQQGLPIGHIQVETAESDNNGRLGAPGAYGSAVAFQDTRLLQQGTVFNASDGGRVEVFASSADAEREYQEQVAGQRLAGGEHLVLDGRVLLMLSSRLPADQVPEYTSALQRVLQHTDRLGTATRSTQGPATPAATAAARSRSSR